MDVGLEISFKLCVDPLPDYVSIHADHIRRLCFLECGLPLWFFTLINYSLAGLSVQNAFSKPSQKVPIRASPLYKGHGRPPSEILSNRYTGSNTAVHRHLAVVPPHNRCNNFSSFGRNSSGVRLGSFLQISGSIFEYPMLFLFSYILTFSVSHYIIKIYLSYSECNQAFLLPMIVCKKCRCNDIVSRGQMHVKDIIHFYIRVL